MPSWYQAGVDYLIPHVQVVNGILDLLTFFNIADSL